MSGTHVYCEVNEEHSDSYSECLVCRLAELMEENKKLGKQVARLQHSTGACEQIRKDQMIEVLTKDFGVGPCAKQVVTATLVAKNGMRFEATNHCDNPQQTCPREGMLTGEGYELCKTVCGQGAHAEINAISLAARHAKGATLHLKGHTYACGSCLSAAEKAGVLEIKIEDSCAQTNSDVNLRS